MDHRATRRNLYKTSWSLLGQVHLLIFKVWSEYVTPLLRYTFISCLVASPSNSFAMYKPSDISKIKETLFFLIVSKCCDSNLVRKEQVLLEKRDFFFNIFKMVENPIWWKLTSWCPLKLTWTKESEESGITFYCGINL